jgi:hypothetical protein
MTPCVVFSFGWLERLGAFACDYVWVRIVAHNEADHRPHLSCKQGEAAAHER